MRKWLLIGGGGLLVLIGALLLGLSRLEVRSTVSSYMGIAGLLIMGIALMAYYVDSQIVAALIAGCLLAGLGMGLLMSEVTGGLGVLFALGGLGLGFFAVLLVDTAVAGRRQTWALIPGTVLVGLGALIVLAGGHESSQTLGILLGTGMLALGVWTVVRQTRNTKRV